MAKQQTFTDKVGKKGAGADLISVKVIMASKTEKGTYRFNEKLVKVKDIAEAEKLVKE